MSREDYPFYPCRGCEFPSLCEWKCACLVRVAEANIKAESPPVYQCKRHPERDTVEPHALRLCAGCLEDARAGYAEGRDIGYRWEARDERRANSLYGGRTTTDTL